MSTGKLLEPQKLNRVVPERTDIQLVLGGKTSHVEEGDTRTPTIVDATNLSLPREGSRT